MTASPSVSPAALMDRIAAGTAPVVLDVRSRLEFDRGHVPGARHVPFWRVARWWRTLAAHRDREIVVYCGHGPRAWTVGAALRRRGFSRVAYLHGHMKKWKAMDLPIEVT